jgi:GntR family transcriptional regulator, transcriptional repressor for pyruvate dehydrogenase complex
VTDPAEKRREETSTATASVADELVRMILGQMAPGASLPSEAELAIQHGVSRVTVREAVKMVAGRGLLDLARGRRAVVKEPDSAALGEFMYFLVQNDARGVFDLVEIRSSLEVQAAGLAARRATRPALAAIETALKDMRLAQGTAGTEEDEAAFHEADVGFHLAIALASGNRILITLFEAMAPALKRSFFMSRRGRQLRGQTSEHTVAAHARILACIVAGDANAAEAAMRNHLADALRDMRAAIDGDNRGG